MRATRVLLSTYLGFVQKAYSLADTFSNGSKCQDTMTHNIYSFLIGILQTTEEFFKKEHIVTLKQEIRLVDSRIGRVRYHREQLKALYPISIIS